MQENKQWQIHLNTKTFTPTEAPLIQNLSSDKKLPLLMVSRVKRLVY